MEHVKNLTQSKLIKNIFVILIGSIILAISSKIKIPFYPVPMTMQTFVVLFLDILCLVYFFFHLPDIVSTKEQK